jgi:hypothetical protein
MLNDNEAAEIRRIAQLAAAARDARDRALRNAAQLDLDEPAPARGEPHAAAQAGFEAVSPDEPAHRALYDAIMDLPAEMRWKLWAVMRTGSGDFARNNWERALSEAQRLPEFSFTSELADEPDLHTQLMKGLYELGVAEEATTRK